MVTNPQPSFETEKQGVKFWLADSWSNDALDKVFAVMRSESRSLSQSSGKTLSGRGIVRFVDLPNIGPVAVKQYRRGGLLRFLVKERYLAGDPPRPAVEWSTLHEAESLGVKVPTPLGFATEGGLLYRAWLFTREIPKHESLSEIAVSDVNRLPPLIESLVGQVSKLIASGIKHVDLHPGNVVVSDSDEVYLLDFDKAHRVSLQKRELRDQYVWRWRRAVIKHKLPEQLSELFCLGLRQSAITD